MYRIDDPSASTTLPVPEAALAEGFWTEGSPGTGTPATLERASWFNMVQEELRSIVVAGGLTPSKTTYNQVLKAIQALMQGSSTQVGVDTGAANAYVVAFTPALTAPVPWVPFWFKVKTTNNGPSTLNATGTAEPLVGGAHVALQGNELVVNGNALVYWNPTLSAGVGEYVLLFCSGAAEQVAPATQPEHAVQLQQVTGLVGAARNLKASLAAAGTSLTFTADEVAVKSALGGGSFLLPNFNQTVSTTAAGIGGVVGTALAASGYAAIYAAYNPSTNTQGAYIVNANALVPNVGAAPPSGWICTGLISVWPLNASSQFGIANQFDRSISYPLLSGIVSSGPFTITSFSIAGNVPPNAKDVNGLMALTMTTNGTVNVAVYENAGACGQQNNNYGNGANVGSSSSSTFRSLRMQTAQTIYFSISLSAGGVISVNVGTTGYSI